MPNPLAWLGAFMPTSEEPELTSEQLTQYGIDQRRRKRQFEKEHPIRAGIGKAVDTGLDFLGGITGLGSSDSTASKIGELIESASDLIPGKAAATAAAKGGIALAGMPFAHYAKRLVHGAPEAFDYIDPARLKEGAHGMKFFGSPEPEMSNFFTKRVGEETPTSGMSLPFRPDAENVLDFIDVDPRDIQKVIRGMDPEVSAPYIDYFNDLMARGKTSDEAYRALAQHIAVPSGVAEKTGFDAIRFPYGNKKQEAWGFPETVPIRSEYGGTSLNPAAGPRPQLQKPSTTPRSTRPQTGDILPSGRRYTAKTEVPKIEPKRMSIAELMATKTPAKKSPTLDEIRRKLNK